MWNNFIDSISGIMGESGFAMLFVGGLAAYTFVWDLADVGIALMTIFNMIVLFPMAKEPLNLLKNYKKSK